MSSLCIELIGSVGTRALGGWLTATEAQRRRELPLTHSGFPDTYGGRKDRPDAGSRHRGSMEKLTMARRTIVPLVLAVAALCSHASTLSGQDRLEDVGFVLGDTTAPVRVIEFGDYGCTTCADFWRDSWPRVKSELIETGRVVWWHVPVTVGYRRGEQAANAARCAAEQDGYWRMHDQLLAEQDEWLRSRHLDELYARMASDAGLDLTSFSACYAENRWEDRTKAATRIARRGIRGLPTFFVNEQPVVGAVPYEFLLRYIEEAERGAGGS